MKQSIKFIYELVKFIVISVPLAILLFLTLTIIKEFEQIILDIRKEFADGR